MFEQASRMKLRFTSALGTLTSEDLWDINLPQLNDVAKLLHHLIEDSKELNFIATQTSSNATLVLKFEIVKHIIKVKLEEAELRSKSAEKRERNQKIMKLISQKKDAVLSEKTVEELEALINKE